MSPLLYLVTALICPKCSSDTSSTWWTHQRGANVETGEQATHSQFANDINFIFEARKEYIDYNFTVFQKTGAASSLFVKEEGVKVVFISNSSLRDELAAYNWNWETEGNFTKLLRVFIGTEISQISMTQDLQKTVAQLLRIA